MIAALAIFWLVILLAVTCAAGATGDWFVAITTGIALTLGLAIIALLKWACAERKTQQLDKKEEAWLKKLR